MKRFILHCTWSPFVSFLVTEMKGLRLRNSVLIISHITFQDCHVHIFFLTTFLEIAVFINDSILMSHILGKRRNVLYHRLPVFLRMTRRGAFFLFHINARIHEINNNIVSKIFVNM